MNGSEKGGGERDGEKESHFKQLNCAINNFMWRSLYGFTDDTLWQQLTYKSAPLVHFKSFAFFSFSHHQPVS